MNTEIGQCGGTGRRDALFLWGLRDVAACWASRALIVGAGRRGVAGRGGAYLGVVGRGGA